MTLTALNILFIGSLGKQSLITLNGLLQSAHTVSAVAVAGSTLGLGNTPTSRRRFIPAINAGTTQSILDIAVERGIPIEILEPGVTPDQLHSHTPDLGIVSCYPHRLQDDLRLLPSFGCFNLHPSLLPKYRGPDPLFWQLWHGETHTGVTLHRVESRLVAGDIICQERLAIADGISEAELNRLCAMRGSALIDNALGQLQQGRLVARPQNDQLASYQGWPTQQDFHVSTEWPVRRISNFIQGTRQRGQPYQLRIGARRFSIDSLADSSSERMPDKAYAMEGNYLRFNCYDGCVKVVLAS